MQVGHRIRRQYYLDSVALMRLSQQLVAESGVSDAALMMASPVNLEIMQNAGLLPEGAADATPADLVIAVSADSGDALEQAFEKAENLLDAPSLSSSADQNGNAAVASLREALALSPESNLALISVPGAFAAAEAAKAVARGMNTMIFSDNVSVEDELKLKQQASEKGVLVMGPDCGTAIVAGVPLAFANRVPRGPVGIVGASGTGIQEVTCLLAHRNIGISHAIGVGGRDLSADVGGLSTLQALDLLGGDESTEVIVLISKPPAEVVRNRVLEKITTLGKPAVVCFVGDTASGNPPKNAQLTSTLEEAVFGIASQMGKASAAAADSTGNSLSSDKRLARSTDSGRQFIRGLYCGGTLCAEAQVILLKQQVGVSSNAAVPGAGAFSAGDKGFPAAHCILDLGADEYTRGKPHPMIETATRDQQIAVALSDPSTAAVLLDCVIGYGAHADPAGGIVAVLEQHRRSSSVELPVVIASVTGTDDDIQNRAQQIKLLESAGVWVGDSNAAAARAALQVIGL